MADQVYPGDLTFAATDSVVLPDYNDPTTSRNELNKLKNKATKLYLSLTESVDVDWKKVNENPDLFNELIDLLDQYDSPETKDEKAKQETINKIKRYFGVNSTEPVPKPSKTKDVAPSKKRTKKPSSIDDLLLNNSNSKKTSSSTKNTAIIKLPVSREKVIFKLNDVDIALVVDQVIFGKTNLNDQEIPFIVLFEKKNRNNIKLKAAALSQNLILKFPKRKLIVSIKPLVFSFPISEYLCRIFLIKKIIDLNERKPVDSTEEETSDTEPATEYGEQSSE
jgi:hypothetical protein